MKEIWRERERASIFNHDYSFSHSCHVGLPLLSCNSLSRILISLSEQKLPLFAPSRSVMCFKTSNRQRRQIQIHQETEEIEGKEISHRVTVTLKVFQHDSNQIGCLIDRRNAWALLSHTTTTRGYRLYYRICIMITIQLNISSQNEGIDLRIHIYRFTNSNTFKEPCRTISQIVRLGNLDYHTVNYFKPGAYPDHL